MRASIPTAQTDGSCLSSMCHTILTIFIILTILTVLTILTILTLFTYYTMLMGFIPYARWQTQIHVCIYNINFSEVSIRAAHNVEKKLRGK